MSRYTEFADYGKDDHSGTVSNLGEATPQMVRAKLTFESLDSVRKKRFQPFIENGTTNLQ